MLSEQVQRKTTHLRSSVCFTNWCFFPKLMGFMPNFQSQHLSQRFQKRVIFHIEKFASSSIFRNSHSTDVVKTVLKQKRVAARLEGINSQTCDGKCFRGEPCRLLDIKVVGW